MKKFLLSLMSVVLVCMFGHAATVNLAFDNIESTGWSNSYGTHSYVTDDYTINFTQFSKQTSTITDVPVCKNGTIVFTLENATFKSVKFNLKQWGTKTNTGTLKYSINGSTFQDFDPVISTSEFTISTDVIPDGVVAVQLSFSNSSNQIGVASIDYEVNEASQLNDPKLSFATETLQVNLGETVPANELTKPEDVTVEYTSSNVEVATVDKTTGTVTLEGKAGKTTITAISEATDTYKAGIASYELVVVDPNATTAEATVIMKDQESLTYAKDKTIEWISSDGIYKFSTIATITGSTYPTSNNNNLRIYNSNGNTITVSVPEGYYFVSASAVLGTAANKIAINKTTIGDSEVYTFDAETVSFELTSVSSNGNKNSDITSMTFVLAKAVVDDRKDAELSFPQAAYTVDFGTEFKSPVLDKPEGLTVSYSSSNPDVATVDPSSGKVSIVKYGETTITAVSEANEEYKEGRASYTLKVVATASTLGQFIELGLEDSALEIRMNAALTVTYVNGNYVYVTDGDSYGLIYGSGIPSYEVNDIIPIGWTGKITVYSGLTEIIGYNGLVAATEKGSFAPRRVTEVTDAMVNEVVIAAGVVFENATPEDTSDNFTGKVGETDLTFRNTFRIASTEAGTYDVKAAVSCFEYNRTTPGGALQLLPIEYMEPAVAPETPDVIVKFDGAAIEYGTDGVDLSKAEEAWFEFEVSEGVSVYHKYTENTPVVTAAETTEDGYTLYTQPVALSKAGELSYYAEANGLRGEVKTLVFVGQTTGVENVVVAGEEAVYYDLQGNRVANPAAGIYIRVAGGKAAKVLVK